MDEDHQRGAVALQHAGQPDQPRVGLLAGDARVDDGVLREPGEHAGIVLAPGGAGAMGEAVAEGEDALAFGQGR